MFRIILSGHLFILIPSILIICCTGTIKKSSVSNIDSNNDWTLHHPTSEVYYIGIGNANNTGNPGEMQSIARNQALKDISTQIKVHITSTEGIFDSSVVSGKKHSDFSSYFGKITTFTESILENVEISETKYKTDGSCWVKMLLSKEAYRKKCNEQVDRARSIAIDAMLAAENVDPLKKVYELHAALEAIDGFKNTLLIYNFEAQDIILNNEILRRLRQTLDDIQLKPAIHELTIGALDSLPDNIGFYVKYQDIPIDNCPLTWSVSNIGVTLLPMNQRLQGFYPIMVSGMSASVGKITISASIDFHKIKYSLEKHGLRLPIASFVLSRNKPSVFPTIQGEFVESLVNELLNSNTFLMAPSATSADYTIKGIFTINSDVVVQRSIFQASGILECTLIKQGSIPVVEIHRNVTAGSGKSEYAAVQSLKKEAVSVVVKEINRVF